MRVGNWVTAALVVALVFSTAAFAATEEAKQESIDKGLARLAATQAAGGYWSYSNDGTLAATGSAALAFIEEGYLPGEDVIIDTGSGPVNYGDVVGKACSYIFTQARRDIRFGVEYAGYERFAEDYNNNGIYTDDGGNRQALYFYPGNSSRNVYTTGIVAPVVYALGEALGRGTVVGGGTNGFSHSGHAVGMTYEQVMRDVVDWFSWGQIEPTRGKYRGGWRYDANNASADNSTAQWGALPLIYADAWGLAVPNYVFKELNLWTDHIQYLGGGSLYGSSGYTDPGDWVSNVAKTGGLLLELYALGVPITDMRVQAALQFISSRWNNGPSGTWFGNLNHPYAMWAVYKGLEVYGLLDKYPGAEFLIGEGMPGAPGGFTIGYEGDTKTSAVGDWYSHYSDLLVNLQGSDGSWGGYSYWTGALSAGWYINILNATGAPPPQPDGLIGFAWAARRRRRS